MATSHKPQASSAKRGKIQATSGKPQAARFKRQATSGKLLNRLTLIKFYVARSEMLNADETILWM